MSHIEGAAGAEPHLAAGRGLRMIAWATGILCANWVVSQLIFRWALHEMVQGEYTDHERFFSMMQNVWLVSGLVSVAALLGLCVGAGRLRHGLEPHRRALATALVVAFAAAALLFAVDWVFILSQDHAPSPYRVWISRALLGAEIAAWMLVAVVLGRAASAGGRRIDGAAIAAMAVLVGWNFGLLLFADLCDVRLEIVGERPWTWFGGRALGLAGMAALVIALTRAAATRMGLAAPAADDPNEWANAAAGLHGYASALAARVVIAFSAVVLLLLSFMGRSEAMLKLTLVAMPLAGVITSAVMLSGLLRFARVRDPHAASSRASAGIIALAVALIAELYTLVVIVRLVGTDGRYRPDTGLLTQMDLAVQVSSLVGLLAVLGALVAVAGFVGRQDLVRRATSLIPIVVVIVGTALVVRYLFGQGKLRDEAVAVILLLMCGVANLLTLLALARSAHDVADAMNEGPAPASARARFRSS